MSVYPRVGPSRSSSAGRDPDIFTIFWPVYYLCQGHRFLFQCHSEGGRRQPGGLVRALVGTPVTDCQSCGGDARVGEPPCRFLSLRPSVPVNYLLLLKLCV